jgi:hypothetical protein
MPEPVPEGIETFHWRDQLRYRCPRMWEGGVRCAYDTHDLDALHAHIRTPHNYAGKAERGMDDSLPKHETDAPSSEVPPELKDVKFAKP